MISLLVSNFQKISVSAPSIPEAPPWIGIRKTTKRQLKGNRKTTERQQKGNIKPAETIPLILAKNYRKKKGKRKVLNLPSIAVRWRL